MILPEVEQKFRVESYGHALEILHGSFLPEWEELQLFLADLKITHADIVEAGGNKTKIAKMFDDALFPLGWKEVKITGDLIIKPQDRAQRRGGWDDANRIVIEGFIDGHNIDFVKNKVAFDLEWNSKDQTFDRDILAMRTYHEAGIIDVGIIVTRDVSLNQVFEDLGVKTKYGASTTWMGKLTPRLQSRRQGGCPILAVGITDKCVVEG